MMDRMSKGHLLEKLRAYFRGREDVAFAYLFGSVAKDRAHSESDVDIGVYFKPEGKALEYESDKRYAGEEEMWSDLDGITGRHTDMVVLNRAPSTLFSEVLHEGQKLYSTDDNLLNRLAGAVDDMAEDFRSFIFDFIKIKERSNSFSANDKARLARILDFINDQMPDFDRFAGIDQRQYEREVDIRRNLERWAETLSNASIDAAKILIASRKRAIPQTYKSIVKELAFLDNFDQDVASRLPKFSDMRNILAHEYLDLRFPVLRDFVKEAKPLYEYLLKYAKNALEKEK